MIYATHKLYDSQHRVTTHKVVETTDSFVSNIYDFECEKHSMQWYDAIVLSSKKQKNCFCRTINEAIELLVSNTTEPLYAYGITYDTEGCQLSMLI